MVKIDFFYSFSLDEQTNGMRSKANNYLVNIMDFMTKIVKNTLSEQDYKQIGRLPKFFCPRDKKDIPHYNLEMWAGYSCAVKCLNDGFFLNIDTSSKFLQKSTV